MLALYQIDYIGENPKTAENSIKSNLRKPDSLDPASPNDEMKKRVQWMDFVGKELVEIREFECSNKADNEDIDSLCVSLLQALTAKLVKSTSEVNELKLKGIGSLLVCLHKLAHSYQSLHIRCLCVVLKRIKSRLVSSFCFSLGGETDNYLEAS
ncbi:hypothetical protein ACLB2K_052822 [Fragaria x ananassa]